MQYVKIMLSFFFMFNFIISSSVQSSNKPTKPKIMVHYMPWYMSKPISGYWGWHWTMNHFDPEKVDETGKREIASHYYPLIGPYDSSDPFLLEYHTLLMKVAGIDGVIIDWYGSKDFYDYAIINRNTCMIINFAEKAGLEYAICYEDQTIKHKINAKYINVEDAIEHGKKDMLYLQSKWFNNKLYLKLDERPVLLVFGPQYFFESSQWDALFSVLNKRPHLFTQDHVLYSAATGAFLWPPVWLSHKVLDIEDCDKFIDDFYRNSKNWDSVIGSAFPGFHDIYGEVGVGKSYAYLDPKEGKTFLHTFQKAMENDVDVIQIVTWNDFGEGTNIEPTREYGYKYLEISQEIKRKYIDPNFNFVNSDLSLCKDLYDQRNKYRDEKDVMLKLDDVRNFLLTGRTKDARKILHYLDEK
ncbi:MAG: glycoside hydrolase family 71/99-like protein [bacterium]